MSTIGPHIHEALAAMELAALRDEVSVLRKALTYYAKPRTYGSGKHSVFIDDTGVARDALATQVGQVMR